MTSNVQLTSLLFSFIYGFLFNFLVTINIALLKKTFPILKLINILLLCIVLSIIYITILYYINNGIVHIYFYLVFLLGFEFYFKCKEKLISVKFKK